VTETFGRELAVAGAGTDSCTVAAGEHPTLVRPLREASRPFLLGLGLIALVALTVRVYFVLVGYAHYKVAGDAVYYHLQGWALADGHGFINPIDYYDYFRHGVRIVTPSAGNPPLYSMYIGLVSRLGFWSVTAHRLASCLLGTGAVVLIGLTGRKMVSERVGLIAALFAALYANLWINDGMLLAESMAALTMSLVLLAAYAFWRRARLASAARLGLALGLAALSRGEVVLLAPLLVLPLLWGMRRLAVAQRFRLLVVTALAMLLLVGPWVGYNLTRFEKPVFMTDHWGTVLEAASCDDAYYGKYAGWYANCDVRRHQGDASEQDAVLRREALHYMRQHLHRLPVVMAMRVGRLWDIYRPGNTLFLNAVLEGRTRAASRVAVASYWLLMPLTIAGLIVMRLRRVPIIPLLAPAIVVTIAAAITYGVLRYRVTVEPGIVLAAAVSVDVLWTSLVDGRRAGVRKRDAVS
jgi:4-amino-4-deoxy-L-arabinose transferase-like glycosyltransferase